MSMDSSVLPPDAEEISRGGFNRFVGPFYKLGEPGQDGFYRYGFVAADRHMNAAGSVHGGMLMTFMDVAMSRTTRLAAGARSLSTVSMSCDFVGPGRLGDLIEARVRVVRASRSFVFMSGEAVAGERPLMNATGLWKIVL